MIWKWNWRTCHLKYVAYLALARLVLAQPPSNLPTQDEPTSTLVIPSPTDSTPCNVAKVDELVGYAAGTTGGGDAVPISVTSCEQLRSGLLGGGVIHIEGTLQDCGILNVKGSTTILGVGLDSGEHSNRDGSWLERR
jgi:hypothetical protein